MVIKMKKDRKYIYNFATYYTPPTPPHTYYRNFQTKGHKFILMLCNSLLTVWICRCQVGPTRPGSPGMSSCPCLLSCSLPLPSLYHAVPSSSDNCFSRSPKVPTSLGFILLTLFFSLYTLSLCFVSYTYSSLGKINPDGLTQWSWEMARTHLASWFLNLDS